MVAKQHRSQLSELRQKSNHGLQLPAFFLLEQNEFTIYRKTICNLGTTNFWQSFDIQNLVDRFFFPPFFF